VNLEKKNPKLEPIKANFPCYFKTKAGSNGKQTKINQDAVVIDTKLPFGLKVYCVCDGHGLNGHHVSGFIKVELISTVLFKLSKRKPYKIVKKAP
jgi:serine/threonine protein phosphatase PrpC